MKDKFITPEIMNTEPHKIRMIDFSKYPGGRNIKYGPDSGELFRRKVLLPALRKYDLIEIDISTVYTYAPGFVDEITAFIIRWRYLTHAEYCRRISFISCKANEFFIKDMFEAFRDEQEPEFLAREEIERPKRLQAWLDSIHPADEGATA